MILAGMTFSVMTFWAMIFVVMVWHNSASNLAVLFIITHHPAALA